MKTKKCFTQPTPEPPPPDPCKLQKIREKEKAGIKVCQRPPIPQPPPPLPCLAICLEKIKNPVIEVSSRRQPVICTVEREKTETNRCDSIAAATVGGTVIPRPRCPPPPTIPPPPTPDPCEEQAKRQKIAECKERMKRYLE